MLAPASGFYYNTDLGKQEVRIAYVLNINDLRKALTCLKKGLEAYPGRISVKKILKEFIETEAG
jgi:aspartate aminotransferase